MKSLFSYLNGKHPRAIPVISTGLIVLLGFIDYCIGYEISFSIFYLLPISLVAWFNKKITAIIFCIVGALTWLWADVASGYSSSHPLIPLWNTLIRLGFFLITALSLSQIRKMLDTEEEFARTDFLTGVNNSRSFYQLAEMEIVRSTRFHRPFTIAYFDVDNFKRVNDTLGHSHGDILLKSVADTIKTNVRSIDIVSRLGGDEFAVLFPETNEVNAKAAISKVQQTLLAMAAKNRWPITFSIGAVTCYESCNLDELVKEADALMYAVKDSGKNGIEYKIHS